MKRILSVLLAVVVLLCLVGCKNKEEQQSTDNNGVYDLLACMNQGKIPEAEYVLGTTPEKIKTDFNYGAESDGHEHDIYVYEGLNSSYLVVEDFYYYFVNGEEEKGISSIVCFSTAFGTEVNGFDTKKDVKNRFSSVNFEEREISSRQAYFVPHEVENWSALTCKTDNRRIDFIFQEDILVAINLVDTENWDLT